MTSRLPIDDVKKLLQSVLTGDESKNAKEITKLTPPLQSIKLIEKLGEGGYATVYLLIDGLDRKFAARVEGVVKKDSASQLECYKKLSTNNRLMAPTLYLFHSGRLGNIYIMDIIYGDLVSLVERNLVSNNSLGSALECLLDKKYIHKFAHGDMHVSNIVVLKDGKTLGFIDFDLSDANPGDLAPALNFLDLIPLLGSLMELDKVIPGSVTSVINFLLGYVLRVYQVHLDHKRIVRRDGGGYGYLTLLNDGTRIYLHPYHKLEPKRDIKKLIRETVPELKYPKLVNGG
jgi:hypothetical protein